MTQKKITKLTAREILDSRGNPTLEVTAWCGDVHSSASVPSGASTGSHEAFELRDQNIQRFHGLGVLKACGNVEKIISKKLAGISVNDQLRVDQRLIQIDGTVDKSKLGANAILGASLAVARLGAEITGQPLYKYIAKKYGLKKNSRMPVPLFNVINGGKHADSGLDIQEFFIIPQRGSIASRIRQASEIYHVLKQNLQSSGFSTGLGDEGGFAPRLQTNEKALQLLMQSIRAAGMKPGHDIALGIDAAASEFFDTSTGTYRLNSGSHKTYKPASIYRLYNQWIKKYPLQIIEDPCSEDDFIGWKSMASLNLKKTIIVGDDLFVTQAWRLTQGVINGIANSILIKPNQVGTLTETIDTVKIAQSQKYSVVVSHRSGETNDSFIADLSVATGADYIKAGAPVRGERVAKYNRLMAIEKNIRGS